MRGMSRLPPAPERKRPITVTLLFRIRSRCDFAISHDRVLWGAAVLSFFILLRRSEYLAERSLSKAYAIQRRVITFTTGDGSTAGSLNEAKSVSIRFRGSKTDQKDFGTTRFLERSGSSWLCPVRTCWYLTFHGRANGIKDDEILCSVKPIVPLRNQT